MDFHGVPSGVWETSQSPRDFRLFDTDLSDLLSLLLGNGYGLVYINTQQEMSDRKKKT